MNRNAGIFGFFLLLGACQQSVTSNSEQSVEEIMTSDRFSNADLIRNPASARQPEDTVNVAKMVFEENPDHLIRLVGWPGIIVIDINHLNSFFRYRGRYRNRNRTITPLNDTDTDSDSDPEVKARIYMLWECRRLLPSGQREA